MPYRVKIIRAADGESVMRTIDMDWKDGDVSWWTIGNFGCDCNRGMEFYRAKGVKEEDIPDIPCNNRENEFTVPFAILPNGTRVDIGED